MVGNNKLHGGVMDLAWKTFTKMYVHNNPLIVAGRAVQSTK